MNGTFLVGSSRLQFIYEYDISKLTPNQLFLKPNLEGLSIVNVLVLDSKQSGLPNKQTDRQINRLSKCTSLILCRVNGLFMNVSSWQGKERNGMYCVIHYMYVCPNKHRNQRIESRLWVLNDRMFKKFVRFCAFQNFNCLQKCRQ